MNSQEKKGFFNPDVCTSCGDMCQGVGKPDQRRRIHKIKGRGEHQGVLVEGTVIDQPIENCPKRIVRNLRIRPISQIHPLQPDKSNIQGKKNGRRN